MSGDRESYCVDVVMPKWGVSMQEGTIAAWYVDEGEAVTKGQPLAAIETDKVNADLEAPAAGRLRRLLVDVGGVAAVGDVVAVITETEEAEPA